MTSEAPIGQDPQNIPIKINLLLLPIRLLVNCNRITNTSHILCKRSRVPR
jgi:hypothetical protein